MVVVAALVSRLQEQQIAQAVEIVMMMLMAAVAATANVGGVLLLAVVERVRTAAADCETRRPDRRQQICRQQRQCLYGACFHARCR